MHTRLYAAERIGEIIRRRKEYIHCGKDAISQLRTDSFHILLIFHADMLYSSWNYQKQS
jgi:hypothetical protein